ncbi:MBL fold metallo-hydrolase [Intrasporangium sp.]|uniref:MBL fold metallo-hydrolase n=1 Tax=Intrasporangium sp. TaxID=1925024 RepID=UPI003221C431
MATELTLLGTAGGPTPRGYRRAPAQVVSVDGGSYVVDCGNGVTDQLVRAGRPLGSLRAVFVTHHHSDHVADVGTLLWLAWSALREPVHVFGPPPLAEAIGHFLAMARYDIDLRVSDEGRVPLDELIEVHEITEEGIVYADDTVTVHTARVDHPPVDHALAYRLDTADRSITISGDTRPCDALVELARGSDVLVHEVLHEPAIGDIVAAHAGTTIREHLLASHTLSDEVGEIARRADVRTLVLSHFVPSDATVDDDTWRDHAARDFDGTVVVGHDLLTI